MANLLEGSCHCGTVKFIVALENGIESVMRCNCSLCRRKGAIMSAVAIEKLQVIEGEESLTLYQWSTGIAKHYFCKNCGIYTHHQRRANPKEFAFNVACIKGIDPDSFLDINRLDGASL